MAAVVTLSARIEIGQRMLPPGALQYLKGHPDGIVTVLLATVALGAIGVGVEPWSATVVLILAQGSYHIRRSKAESHSKDLAQVAVDKEVTKVELAKVRHRNLLSAEQPLLPLDIGTGKSLGSRSAAKKGGKQ